MLTVPAADAILSAVYWHPGFAYEITQIWVLNPVQVYAWHGSELKNTPARTGTDATRNRTPRSKHLLHDPAYLIEARLVLRPELRAQAREWSGKYFGILRKRLERGQLFEQPYFGQREYACHVDLPTGDEHPWNADADLGPFPLQVQDIPDPRGPLRLIRHHFQEGRWNAETYPGRKEAAFFDGLVRGGVLHVPHYRWPT